MTQNTWRQGLALGNAPDARILHWGYQHVGILEPNANPRSQSVEYRWRWVSGVGHVYFMYISCIFHVVCASFFALATRELADAKADFSGIWAFNVGSEMCSLGS